jgi:hypothetical protein
VDLAKNWGFMDLVNQGCFEGGPSEAWVAVEPSTEGSGSSLAVGGTEAGGGVGGGSALVGTVRGGGTNEVGWGV